MPPADDKTVVRPVDWQDPLGFAQAVQVTGAERLLVCSAEGSVSPDGASLHHGDLAAQTDQCLGNRRSSLRRPA